VPVLQKNNTPSIRELLKREPKRATAMVTASAAWRLDCARIPVALADWRHDFAPAAVAPLKRALDELFQGAVVNSTESRPALHMALRACEPARLAGPEDGRRIFEARERMLALADQLHGGQTPVQTLLHAGIGGSDLGPRLVEQALAPDSAAIDVEWLTTLDATRLRRLLEGLDPRTTGLVVASKSFSTVETLTQARAIRDWLGEGAEDRIWAATAKPVQAHDFGVAADNVLAFPEWVGGRYSLWSGVGLSAAARIGAGRWKALLAGAERFDSALLSRPEDSIALALARAIDSLVRSGFAALGVVSYAPGLRLLAEYLQQLVMESLGKSVDPDGMPVTRPTSPLVFGGAGTDLQHSLFQALHQGTTRHPMLLMGTTDAEPGFESWQREQLAHLLGQASALVHGRTSDRPEQVLPGENPVMLMIAPRLTAEALGELLAAFEHAVYLLGVLMDVNPFDQWGVEEGKRLAGRFRAALAGEAASPDASLNATLEWIRAQS